MTLTCLLSLNSMGQMGVSLKKMVGLGTLLVPFGCPLSPSTTGVCPVPVNTLPKLRTASSDHFPANALKLQESTQKHTRNLCHRFDRLLGSVLTGMVIHLEPCPWAIPGVLTNPAAHANMAGADTGRSNPRRPKGVLTMAHVKCGSNMIILRMGSH